MDKNCSIYQTMGFMGKKWTLLILLEIHKGKNETKRYTDIKNAVPSITSKILSTRLKELEKEGLITKFIDSTEVPIKVEYSLTESGKDFIKVIKEVKNWTLKWKMKKSPCKNRKCEECGL